MNQKKDNSDKALLGSLKELIDRTYVLENEYKDLSSSYKNLQTFLKEILEVTPNALWVFNPDESIFLQNSEAKIRSNLIANFNFSKEKYELEVDNEYFLVKTNNVFNKIIVNATDITNEKKINRLAAMGQISAHLAHEIRNPIGSISILCSTILKRADSKLQPIAHEMKKSIWRVERIIKSTLLFSKDLKLEKSFFSIVDFMEELRDSIKSYSFQKDIIFNLSKSSEVLYADYNLMLVVFQNFIFNAIDAIEEDDNEEGIVSIEFKKTYNKNQFIIYDSGKELENKKILFEPFKTTKTKGNGLGLALSLQIVKEHSGEIYFLENPKRFIISF